MVSSDHHGLALPVPSYCRPWSSKPWVISCPMTIPMAPKLRYLGQPPLKNGGWRIPAGNAIMSQCKVMMMLYFTVLIVLWFGEYQALTMAGCINQMSLWGSSLNVINSCLADHLFIDKTFSKKTDDSILASLKVFVLNCYDFIILTYP